MLLYVRHGSTLLNGKGSEERLRGWLPVGLTKEGHRVSQETAAKLSGIVPATFSTSDLPRAIQTAEHLSKTLGMPATPTEALRDWNTGSLAGQHFSDVKDHLFHLIDNPDEPAPDGEPLNAYLERFIPRVSKLVTSPDIHIVVGHARGSQVLSGLSEGNGEFVDKASLKNKPEVAPGHVMIVSPDWSILPSK